MTDWISTKDQLPEAHKKVLCATSKGIKILSLSPPGKEYKRYIDWQGEVVSNVIQRLQLEEVTHWQPLPPNPT